MPKAGVFNNGVLAGVLEKRASNVYTFTYADAYFNDAGKPGISLTLPKTQKLYESKELFSFFYGLLTEGINKDMQCRLLKIDENDDFTRLIKTAGEDTIGAITVKELKENT